jgi:TonB family protein
MWTTALAAVAVVIAGLIVGLMVWRVGWGGATAKQSVASPRVVQASPTPVVSSSGDRPTPAAQKETLELGSVSSQPKISVPARNVAVMAAKKEAIPSAPRGGLAIYDEKGTLIYGSPIADPDQPSAKPAAPKQQRTAPKQVAKATPLKSGAHSAGDARLVQLSPEIAENLLLDRIEPDYPDAARRARIQGSVTMEALIGADGKVQQVSPISGNPQLANAATAAVRQWRYKPYVVDGRKVPVRTQVTVLFMLAQ